MNCSPLSSATARLLAACSFVRRGIEQAVLPHSCAFCGVMLGIQRSAICDDCYADLPWIGNACARCANPLVTQSLAGVHCAACQKNPPPFAVAIAPLEYAFPVDAAIKALKFRRKLFYVAAFANLLANAIRQLPADVDGLLPVPLHWRRHAMRGFNQAAELCRPIRKATGLPIVKNVVRRRATPYQSSLLATHRRRNLTEAFRVRGTLRGRHVLIVDDVITTGETCRQLAKIVLDAGVKKVSVLAIARATAGKHL